VKIYTRTGDAGETGLLGGERVRKSVLRVDTYGEIDELNASLGVVRAAITDPETISLLTGIQRDLFAMGARLADSRGEKAQVSEKARLREERVHALERAIDAAEASLPPLKTFIIPGGNEAGARLHVARAVCRRAERRLVALAAREEVPPLFLAYLNRLSDLLFVLARLVNHRAEIPDTAW
jgi:cob(I)alamin adenosyltransferase